MSLAQRRTTLDGIETISLPLRDADAEEGQAGGGSPVNDNYNYNAHDRQQRQQNANDEEITNSGSREETSETATIVADIVPAEDDKEIWQTISYDPFGTVHSQEVEVLPELQHYESFPSELGDHVAAYEVSTSKRVGQVIFAVVACVLASGIVCGFAALKPILIAEGVYSSLCPADWPSSSSSSSSSPLDRVPCPEQDMRLNLFFITASITLNVSTVLAGWVLDNRGRRTCYLLAALILFLGGTCMALAFHLGEDLDKMYHVDGYVIGNVLLGLGGNFLFVSSYQLANAFPRHAGLVVALVTGAFDASAAVFLLYRLAYEHFSHSSSSSSSSSSPPTTAGWGYWLVQPTHFFLGFALVVPALLLVAEVTLMPSASYHTRRAYQAAIAHAQDATRDTHDSDDELYAHKPPAALQRARQRRASRREAALEALETVTGDAAARRADRVEARARQAASGVDGILQGWPVARQMGTPWFWLLLALTVLQMTRMNYFIATVRAQYRYMLGGEDGLAQKVNSFFDVALPVAGVVTTPFIGILLNEAPVWGTLAILTVLIVVLGVLNCLGTLAAGYATVVAFVVFRPLYYSATSDYATKVFGFATFGRVYGTIICISGVGQFIQPALDELTHGPLHNNPVPLNVSFAVAGSLISAALTLFVYTQSRALSSGRGHKSPTQKNRGANQYARRHRGHVEASGTDEERRELLRADEHVREERYGTC